MREVVIATNPTTTGEATAHPHRRRLRGDVADHPPRQRAARRRRPRARRRGHAGPRALRAGARSAASPSDWPIRGCRRRSGAGAHQFHLPSSSISDGTSRARTIVASIRTARAVPRPTCLMKMICEVTNAPMAIENRSAAAVMMRPVRSRPIATASESERAAVASLLDPGEQEDAVVGGQAERDREQEQGLGGLEAALAVVAEQALEAARPGRSAPGCRRPRSGPGGS